MKQSTYTRLWRPGTWATFQLSKDYADPQDLKPAPYVRWYEDVVSPAASGAKSSIALNCDFDNRYRSAFAAQEIAFMWSEVDKGSLIIECLDAPDWESAEWHNMISGLITTLGQPCYVKSKREANFYGRYGYGRRRWYD